MQYQTQPDRWKWHGTVALFSWESWLENTALFGSPALTVDFSPGSEILTSFPFFVNFMQNLVTYNTKVSYQPRSELCGGAYFFNKSLK